MPLLEFVCNVCEGYEERNLPLAQFDFAQKCSRCGGIMHQVLSHAPGMVAQFSGVGRHEEEVYRTHNATRRESFSWGERQPLSPAQGCQCGDCSSHVRRAAVTSVAEPGKDR